MTVTKFENPIVFDIAEAFTHGVAHGKYGGYCVPTKLEPDGEHVKTLKELADKHDAHIKFYGADKSTLYLRCDQLTMRHKEELLDMGRMIIHVAFECDGTYTRRDGTTHLNLELTGIAKVGVPEKVLKPKPVDLS